MSKKSRSRADRAAKYAQPIEFLICDSQSRLSVGVAPPVFQQLLRRGWATQRGQGVVAKSNGRSTLRYVAVLVDRLSLRSATITPEGNLQIRSLELSDGASIKSQWEIIVEKKWALNPRARCAYSLAEAQELLAERVALIEAECRSWGVPKPQPLRTGAYLTPEAAALAIAERQAV